MKLFSHHAFSLLALAGLLVSAIPADAQDAPKKMEEELVKIPKVNIAVQKTPTFQATGVTDKRTPRPKEWLEIEADIGKIVRPKAAKDAEVIPELTFKYFVFLNGAKSENARILTASVVHTNVPIGEPAHSVVYISPDTIRRVTGKPEGNVNLVSMYAIEVTMGGELVGAYTSKPGRWWELPTAPKQEEILLNKSETPFAPLWGDYHLGTKPAK